MPSQASQKDVSGDSSCRLFTDKMSLLLPNQHSRELKTQIPTMKVLSYLPTDSRGKLGCTSSLMPAEYTKQHLEMIQLNKVTYGCESWMLRNNEETRLEAYEIKGLRKTLRVSWTAKKTNEWVLNKAGVKRKLLDTVKARKLAYYGHTMRKQGLPGERNNARNNARCQ